MANDNNLSGEPGPDVTTPQSYDEQIEDISDLLDDPETDPVEELEDSEAAKPTPEDDDDPLGLEVEAEDVDEADAEDPDGSEEPEIKGGRFAPDSAKVTLEDGTVITVADLKRNNLFQRDYTKKTTELSAEREQITALKSEVDQDAQQLSQFREYATWYAENFLIKQPTPPATEDDFVGWHNYRLEMDKYNAHAQAYQAFQEQQQVEEQKKTGETQKQAKTRFAHERDALLKAMPVLKDPVKGKATWDAIVSGASEHYGITAQEVNTVGDHRMLVALRDALAYRRIKAKAPQVQAQVAQKPAMKPGKRAAPNAAISKERQVRSERLRNSGSFEDGIAALQDFDL